MSEATEHKTKSRDSNLFTDFYNASTFQHFKARSSVNRNPVKRASGLLSYPYLCSHNFGECEVRSPACYQASCSAHLLRRSLCDLRAVYASHTTAQQSQKRISIAVYTRSEFGRFRSIQESLRRNRANLSLIDVGCDKSRLPLVYPAFFFISLSYIGTPTVNDNHFERHG